MIMMLMIIIISINDYETFSSGKIFSLLAILENIGSTLSSAMYSYGIYPATVHWFPGFCMVLSAVLFAIGPLAVSV